jgi:hypothetical protein
MSIKIQEGKCYVMRYGGITGVMKRSHIASSYLWTDGQLSWTEFGIYSLADHEHGRSIIAEYTQPEPLPCTLRAGCKYDTITPSGKAGPIVETYERTKGDQFASVIKLGIVTGGMLEYGVADDGLIVGKYGNGPLNGHRIVREHVPQPTPIERLETLVGRMKETPTPLGILVLQKEFVAEIDSALADLKATVKP